jgi:sulfatase maturation enzyme AslB (radical SAM superfamily)
MVAPNNLVIYLSGLCNLNCSYCYAQKNIFQKPIEKRKLISIVAKFLSSQVKDKKITFLGGEPLLHFDLINAVLTFIKKEKKKDLPVHIFSNGLLIDAKISKFIKDFNINLIISINAGEISGGISKVKDIVKKKFKYIDIQSVAVSIVIEKKFANELFENILTLYALGFRHIAWSPDITKIWNEKEILTLKREMLKLRRHYFQLIKKGSELYEIANTYEIIDKICERPFEEACRSAVLSPDGNFMPCDKLIGSDKKSIKKYASARISGGRKKTLFFKEALKYGAQVKSLMCPVGAFAYEKYVSGSTTSEIKKAIKMHIKLSSAIEKNYFSLFKQALKYPAFRKVHTIDG